MDDRRRMPALREDHDLTQAGMPNRAGPDFQDGFVFDWDRWSSDRCLLLNEVLPVLVFCYGTRFILDLACVSFGFIEKKSMLSLWEEVRDIEIPFSRDRGSFDRFSFFAPGKHCFLFRNYIFLFSIDCSSCSAISSTVMGCLSRNLNLRLPSHQGQPP